MTTTTTGAIGVTTLERPNDLEIVVVRVVRASQQRAFAMFTDPRHVPNWMTGPAGWTMPVCEIDLRTGGAWRYVWRKDDGTEMEMRGAYRDVVAPLRVVTTERWGAEWPETVNTVEFHEDHGFTTITMTIRYPSAEARARALATGMTDGMNLSYARLDRYLATLG
jgi:uncharacterized protein YndB with AHSA1/START domain